MLIVTVTNCQTGLSDLRYVFRGSSFSRICEIYGTTSDGKNSTPRLKSPRIIQSRLDVSATEYQW